MGAVIIHPKLTLGDNAVADAFYETFRNELEEHTDVRNLKTMMHLHTATLQSDELVVIFNREDQDYSENVLGVIRQALELGCTLVPVALFEHTRNPASLCSHLQSFEVVDQLRQRRLTDQNIDTIAFALTRLVMSLIQPTMAVHQMELFISHRRKDGELLAAAFYNEFRRRADEVEVFRDLINIRVGQDAQEEIEKNLYQSDAVIFIDTPLSGESIWVEKELRIALGLNIPIVWVKVGSDTDRALLNVKPGDSPHFVFENLEEENLITEPLIIDNIIHKAFQISRSNAMSVMDHFNRLQNLANSKKIELIPVHRKTMLYQVNIPRKYKELHYHQRPLIHFLQLFGRNPKVTDKSGFDPLLSELGLQAHPQLGYNFDSGLLLGPQAPQRSGDIYEPISVDSIDGYVTSLQKYLTLESKPAPRKGVIISGAFPDVGPELQQQMTNAVYCFAKAILDKGGIIIFGSHPTFQHMILDLAKRQRPDDYISSVHMYISKFFAAQAGIDELTAQATVYATENINNDRAASLTEMRQAMITDVDAAGIIVLGGKQHKHIKPGVDEELELARQRGLPAFLIGSVGGRSAELAQQMMENGNCSINSLALEQNKRLATSLDYRVLADEILTSLGFV
ncbi:TIR domain-containing protein [Brevibacillus panacihumi]|uniref:SLOG domain-containing protein n=1 Tax=Brevibacillus panacihumi TaxID=497735 RepID=UPI003D20979E